MLTFKYYCWIIYLFIKYTNSLKPILTQFIHVNILYFQRAIQTPIFWFSWAKL